MTEPSLPWRARRSSVWKLIGYPFAAVAVVGGFTMSPAAGVLATCVSAWLVASLSASARADGSGITVRNAFRTRYFPWSSIQGIGHTGQLIQLHLAERPRPVDVDATTVSSLTQSRRTEVLERDIRALAALAPN